MKVLYFKLGALRAAPLALLLSLTLVTGCGGGAGESPAIAVLAKPTAIVPNIRGLVQAGGPLTDAVVQLQAPGAQPVTLARATELAADLPRTNAYGSFAFTGKLPGGRSEIVVRGGQLGNAAFTGTLRARLDNYQPGKDAVAVNIATTLVAAVMDAEPRLSLTDAEAKVRAALKLPAGVPMKGLGSQYGLFDNAAFFREAAATGFDAQIAQVVAQILSADAGVSAYTEAGRKGRQPVFSTKNSRGGAAADLLGWSIGEFAGGAVSYMGTNAFLYVLSQAGVPDFMGSGDMAAVRDALSQISTQLSNLSHQINQLQIEIGCDIAKEGYDNGMDGTRTNLFDQIDAYSNAMTVLASTDSSDTATIADLKSMMTGIAEKYTTAHADLYNYAMGNAAMGTRGVIDAYSAVYKKCGPIIGVKKSQALKAQFDYVTVHQIMACNMVTSYYLAKGDAGSTTLANGVAAACTGYLTDIQTRQIDAQVQDGWVVDSRTNRIWALMGYVHPSAGGWPPNPPTGGLWYLPDYDDLGGFAGDCYTGNGHAAFKACMKSRGWVDANGNGVFSANDFFVFYNPSYPVPQVMMGFDVQCMNAYGSQAPEDVMFVGPDGNGHGIDNCWQTHSPAWALGYTNIGSGPGTRFYN